MLTENLTDEQDRVFWGLPIHKVVTRQMNAATKLPHFDLHIAGKNILARSPSGKGLTACALAKELKVSRMTLYRKFGKDKLREVLDTLYSWQTRELPSERIATGKKSTKHRDKETPLRRRKARH
jgi:hypothetical protein